MKKGIHPKNYNEVVFKDITSGELFVAKSTVKTSEKIIYKDKEYPLFIIDSSSASHPFYTGQSSSSKLKGRVEKFNKRFSSYNK